LYFTIDACAFTATTRQLEYQIRIAYAQADTAVQLKHGPIFDHVRWQASLMATYRQKQTLWTPWELLLQSYDKYERFGCPTVKGLNHWTKQLFHITNGGESVQVDKIREQITNKMPLIAVVHIHADYVICGRSIYMGKAPIKESTLATHAVVIVGDYEAPEDNEYGLNPGTYYLYQDWFHRDEPRIGNSVLPNGISILHPQLVVAAYYGVSRVPNILVGEDVNIGELKDINNDKLRDKRHEKRELNYWLLLITEFKGFQI
jgi:hypothetical protein